METWKPFITAPENGSDILVFREDAGIFIAFPYHDGDSLRWFADGGEDISGDLPTHWQPLPKPPQIKEAA